MMCWSLHLPHWKTFSILNIYNILHRVTVTCITFNTSIVEFRLPHRLGLKYVDPLSDIIERTIPLPPRNWVALQQSGVRLYWVSYGTSVEIMLLVECCFPWSSDKCVDSGHGKLTNSFTISLYKFRLTLLPKASSTVVLPGLELKLYYNH